ncbi:hypothetical protein TSAR_006649 [Trichomalopsis sarcophagae]|uniref:Odorant receptor n=1 Tax=Trichomalopsis sarcophagae TaxID=543379 RepID=A0A232F4B9_9HYME|nr:hypothetical protein TSAR_006649 [Trichomalopsis sarcophagae]
MDLFHNEYFNINKYVSMICGLWPYQSQFRRRISYMIFAMSTFSIIFSLTAGIISQLNPDLLNILETCVALFFCVAGFLMCTILYNQKNQIKRLYERIAADWENLTDDLERDVLRAFLLEGRKLISFTLVYSFPAFSLFACITFLPRMFSEESTKLCLHSFPYYLESMVIDKNLCNLQVCLHYSIALGYVGLSFLSAGATYICSVKHVCALYEIARQRLENATVRYGNYDPLGELTDETSIIRNLIEAIDMHKNALRGIQIIEQVFSTGFFIIQIFALSLLAILICELKYHEGEVTEMIRFMLVLSVFVIYLFFMNWSGEQVIQSCDDIQKTAYDIDWHRISSKTRIFVLMIMQRTLKPVHLTAGNMMILSITNFGTILKSAWSFGTILLTTQKSV